MSPSRSRATPFARSAMALPGRCRACCATSRPRSSAALTNIRPTRIPNPCAWRRSREMVDKPDNVVLRLLREIRSAQQQQGETLDQHSGALARLEKRVENLYTMSTHTLGVAVT